MGKIFEALKKNDPAKESELFSKSAETPEALRIPLGDYDKNLITLLNPNSSESEQFKMIRSNILFPVSGMEPRTMMITSALPNEGKSFVSANLAVSIAQYLDRHVLLMDCDMRLPTIPKYFGFGDVPGLSEYLNGAIPLSSLFLKTKIDRLTIIPGGAPPHNPSELLSSRKMTDLLEEIKSKYPDRYVIIDSPPPKLTSEANVIARLVDGIIIVIRQGKTPRDIIAEIVERLGKDKIIGIILNRFEAFSVMKYKYSKYDDYYLIAEKRK